MRAFIRKLVQLARMLIAWVFVKLTPCVKEPWWVSWTIVPIKLLLLHYLTNLDIRRLKVKYDFIYPRNWNKTKEKHYIKPEYLDLVWHLSWQMHLHPLLTPWCPPKKCHNLPNQVNNTSTKKKNFAPWLKTTTLTYLHLQSHDNSQKQPAKTPKERERERKRDQFFVYLIKECTVKSKNMTKGIFLQGEERR